MESSLIYEFTPCFVEEGETIYRPILPVAIVHNKIEILTFGLVDSGADECSFPGSIGRDLGHNIEKGKQREISWGWEVRLLRIFIRTTSKSKISE